MRHKTYLPLTGLLVLALLFLAACGGAAPAVEAPAEEAAPTEAVAPAAEEPAPAVEVETAAPSGEPIRFGVVQPLTGPVAEGGAHVVSGIEIAVDRINADGGVMGRPLEAVVVDGKCDPQESSNAAQLLITRDKVPVLLGAYCSSATLAVMPLLEQEGVPMVVETSSSWKITDPGTPGYAWVYRTAPTSGMEAAAAEPLLAGLGVSKVAVMSVNNDWGRGAAEEFGSVIQNIGGEVVSTDFIDTLAVDFSPQLTAIKNSDADTLLITTDVPQVAGILKQFRELGLTQTVLSSGGVLYPELLIELTNQETAEGVYSVVFWLPGMPETAGDPELSAWYVEEYNRRGLPATGLGESWKGFDATYVIANAFEASGGNLDSASLNDALKKVEFDGLGGHIAFTEAEGHQTKLNVYIGQIRGGILTTPE